MGCPLLLEAACSSFHMGCSNVATHFVRPARRGPRAGLPTGGVLHHPSGLGINSLPLLFQVPSMLEGRLHTQAWAAGLRGMGGHLGVCPPQQKGQGTCWPLAPVWPLSLLRLTAELEHCLPLHHPVFLCSLWLRVVGATLKPAFSSAV